MKQTNKCVIDENGPVLQTKDHLKIKVTQTVRKHLKQTLGSHLKTEGSQEEES